MPNANLEGKKLASVELELMYIIAKILNNLDSTTFPDSVRSELQNHLEEVSKHHYREKDSKKKKKKKSKK